MRRLPASAALFTVLFIIFSLTGNVSADGFFDYEAGGADAPVSGSASADGASGAAPSLEKCEKTFGVIAVVEPQDAMMQVLLSHNLPAPTQLLRMMIQQSNCFQVVERGMAMQNIMQEKKLAAGGQLQQGQNMGGGQLVAADFLLTPTVLFSESDTGGADLFSAIGSLFGSIGAAVGEVAGSIKNQQAQTSIIISDARSGLQLAAAEGNVEKADFSIGGVLGGGGARLGGSAYSNTAQGKIVAAALLANYNNVVTSIRNLPQLADSKISSASKQNAQTAAEANAFSAGQVLRPKIAGIQLFANPEKGQEAIAKFGRDSEMIFVGEEENGFLKVQAPEGEGWVKKMFVK
jgi:hypothetical protein